MKKIPSVLIIDDNPADHYLSKRALLRANVIEQEEDVFIAEDGEEALKFLTGYDNNKKLYGNKFPPIFILLDINMPIMNGFEFLDEYKSLYEQSTYNSVIIMMLTSSENPSDIDRISKYDYVKGFITKPLTKDKINDIIEKCLTDNKN